MEIKSEFSDCDVDYMYCRCCFQLFNDSSNRYDFTFDFLSSIHDLFQFKLKFEGTDSSRWICEKCYEIVTNFRKFKNETLEKQAKFSMLIATNQHKELSYIQNLTMTTVALKLEFEDEMVIKNETIKIKNEPMEDLPETVVIEMPWEPMEKKKRDRPSCRPSYEPYKNPVPCTICKKKYLNIVTHRIKMHGLKFVYKCDKDKNCKFSTYEYKKYANHRKTHIPEPEYRKSLKLCPYCACYVKNLDSHINIVHLNAKNFFCDLCEYASYTKEILRNHVASKHIEKFIKCKDCNYKTSMHKSLKLHIENRHSNKNREPTFTCTFADCSKKFLQESGLTHHIKRIHFKTLDFHCEHPDCKRSFYSKSDKQAHVQNVHAPKNFVCDTCGNSFSSAKMLRNHSKIHEEYTFSCSYCDHKAKNQNNLSMHIKRNHTHIKDHKCDQCEKSYYGIQDLKHHIAYVHLKIRFKCQVPGCSSSLSRVDVYRNHLKSHNLNENELKDIMQKCKEFMEENNLIA